MNMLPVLMLVNLLVCCVAIALSRHPRSIAIFSALLNLVFACSMAFAYEPNGSFACVTRIPWVMIPDLFRIHFHLGVDGISLPMVLLTAIVTCAAVAVSSESVQRPRLFFICLLCISLGALGAFLSLDLFFLYLFHEVALIPTFLLIGIWGGHNRKDVALKITLYLTVGSLVLLAGLLAFYFGFPEPYRTLDLTELRHISKYVSPSASSQGVSAILLLVGFGILVSLWPFHNWAPQGYASAPPAVAMMHAGVLKKFGIFGLIRMATPFLPAGLEQLANLILVLLLFNVLYCGFVTIAQKDLGLMLGYSSVMHMGYLFLGLMAHNVIGLTGVVLLMVGHGLSTALLFALSGEIRQRIGTLNLDEMGGLAKKAPVLCVLFMVGAMASIGLPGLANFSGEILIYFGAWKQYPATTALALVGIVISAVYMLRATRNVFFGHAPESISSGSIQDLGEKWPYVLLVIGLLVVGVAPGLFVNWIEPSLWIGK